MSGGHRQQQAFATHDFLGAGELPDRLLSMGDPNDVRFQFEVVRQLAESIRQQTSTLTRMQEQMAAMSERLARIEANRVHEDVERLRASLVEETKRVDALMRDKDRRDGAIGAWTWLQRSAPWAAIATAGAAILAWLKS